MSRQPAETDRLDAELQALGLPEGAEPETAPVRILAVSGWSPTPVVAGLSGGRLWGALGAASLMSSLLGAGLSTLFQEPRLVEVPVERVVERTVERLVEKEVRVEVPVERIVERVVRVPVDRIAPRAPQAPPTPASAPPTTPEGGSLTADGPPSSEGLYEGHVEPGPLHEIDLTWLPPVERAEEREARLRAEDIERQRLAAQAARPDLELRLALGPGLLRAERPPAAGAQQTQGPMAQASSPGGQQAQLMVGEVEGGAWLRFAEENWGPAVGLSASLVAATPAGDGLGLLPGAALGLGAERQGESLDLGFAWEGGLRSFQGEALFVTGPRLQIGLPSGLDIGLRAGRSLSADAPPRQLVSLLVGGSWGPSASR
jgi:hypothetical protein